MANDKKTVRFNIIDLVIIIAVLAIVAALVIRQFFGAGGETAGNGAAYSRIVTGLEVSGIQQESEDYIKVGDTIRDDKGVLIARIASVAFSPATTHQILETGEIKEVVIPTRIDAEITIESVGKASAREITLNNGKPLEVSQSLNMTTPKINIIGNILSVTTTDITKSEYDSFISSLAE